MSLQPLFRTEKTLFTLSGFYPLRSNKYKIARIASASLNFVVATWKSVSIFILIILEFGNPSKVMDLLPFFITHTTFIVKLLNFLYHRRMVLDIEDSLQDPVYRDFGDQIKKRMISFNKTALGFRICCIGCVITWGLVPISSSEEKPLPLPGWMPYDTKNFYFYPLTYIYDVLSVAVSAYNNSTLDTLCWRLLSMSAAQFDILKEHLSAINFDGERADFEIVKCVNHHKKILELLKKIEELFSNGIFVQFAASALVICVTGFQFIVVPIDSLGFALMVTFFMAMMCQVSMYCWYGHDVMTTSDGIITAFYMSNWNKSSSRARKNLLILLQNCQRPSVVRAGNFIPLSLPTLLAILRSSYSYFAVLQRMYGKSNGKSN